jgi:hypothetical protein
MGSKLIRFLRQLSDQDNLSAPWTPPVKDPRWLWKQSRLMKSWYKRTEVFTGRGTNTMDLDDQFTVFYSTVYKARAEGKKCHAKTMMSIKPDRAQNKHPWSMCRIRRYFLLSKNNKHCCVSLRYSVQSETPYDFFYRPTIFKARPGDYIITLMCITDMWVEIQFFNPWT